MAFIFANVNLNRPNLVDLKKEALSICKTMSILKITKINRKANMVAHEIAKFNLINRSDGILMNSVPSCVARAVYRKANMMAHEIVRTFVLIN